MNKKGEKGKVFIFDKNGTLSNPEKRINSFKNALLEAIPGLHEETHVSIIKKGVEVYKNNEGDVSISALLRAALPDSNSNFLSNDVLKSLEEVVKEADDDSYPEVKSVFHALRGHLVISTSESSEVTKKWIAAEGLDCVKIILGAEDGPKTVHREKLRQLFPEASLIFVSDTPREMNLGYDKNVGIYRTKNGYIPNEIRDEFMAWNACAVISDLSQLAYVIEEH